VPVRELVLAVLMAKGRMPGDDALIESILQPLRNAMSEAKALGRVRLVGVGRSRLSRWEIAQAGETSALRRWFCDRTLNRYLR
jgi:hypothetical protein